MKTIVGLSATDIANPLANPLATSSTTRDYTLIIYDKNRGTAK